MVVPRLHGLVLAGGFSKRMGADKAALVVSGRPLVAQVFGLVSRFTDTCFVSCRAEQGTLPHLRRFPQLHDKVVDMGPLGGIQRAFESAPNVAWLVVACDMPYLDESALRMLVERRHTGRVATCFWNHDKQWPEPLCTIYEPAAAESIAGALAQDRRCPRKMLMNVPIETMRPANIRILANMNTPEAYVEVQQDIGAAL